MPNLALSERWRHFKHEKRLSQFSISFQSQTSLYAGSNTWQTQLATLSSVIIPNRKTNKCTIMHTLWIKLLKSPKNPIIRQLK